MMPFLNVLRVFLVIRCVDFYYLPWVLLPWNKNLVLHMYEYKVIEDGLKNVVVIMLIFLAL